MHSETLDAFHKEQTDKLAARHIDVVQEDLWRLRNELNDAIAFFSRQIDEIKAKVTLETKITSNDLLKGKYIIAQKGKKNYYLIIAE